MNNPIYVPMNGESSSTNGKNSNLQSRRIKSAITKCFSGAKVTFNKGHYYCSAFVDFGGGNIVYMSTSDYRFCPDCFLVRKVSSDKDYTGGVNYNFEGFEKILSAIDFVKNR
jgi:hypothetical protein